MSVNFKLMQPFHIKNFMIKNQSKCYAKCSEDSDCRSLSISFIDGDYFKCDLYRRHAIIGYHTIPSGTDIYATQISKLNFQKFIRKINFFLK